MQSAALALPQPVGSCANTQRDTQAAWGSFWNHARFELVHKLAGVPADRVVTVRLRNRRTGCVFCVTSAHLPRNPIWPKVHDALPGCPDVSQRRHRPVRLGHGIRCGRRLCRHARECIRPALAPRAAEGSDHTPVHVMLEWGARDSCWPTLHAHGIRTVRGERDERRLHIGQESPPRR